MPVVIGKDESVSKVITCKNCGSVLKYYPSEVRTLWSGTDYGGGPDGAKGFNCPGCGQKVITESW